MQRLAFEVFTFSPSDRRSDRSPLTFGSSIERYHPNSATLVTEATAVTTLLRFVSPLARSDSSLLNPGLPHPIRSACRLSQPLSGLLLETP
jgi:hypothetical protein